MLNKEQVRKEAFIFVALTPRLDGGASLELPVTFDAQNPRGYFCAAAPTLEKKAYRAYWGNTHRAELPHAPRFTPSAWNALIHLLLLMSKLPICSSARESWNPWRSIWLTWKGMRNWSAPSMVRRKLGQSSWRGY